MQVEKNKEKRVLFIEKIFEDVTHSNAEDPRAPPMTYKDIRSHIEGVLDANDVLIVTPRMGILLAESDKSLLLKEAEDKPKKTMQINKKTTAQTQ